jgi:hypothetical protein
MLYKDLIPKDKTDISTAWKLNGQPYENVEAIVPDLLIWLQDMNWPVAGPVAAYLETISFSITSEIIKILRGNDSTWKYWCLVVFGRGDSIDPILLQEIRQLIPRVTIQEIEEGVLEVAEKILKKNGG